VIVLPSRGNAAQIDFFCCSISQGKQVTLEYIFVATISNHGYVNAALHFKQELLHFSRNFSSGTFLLSDTKVEHLVTIFQSFIPL
jgi:hypothetical protein